jgi:hypothetical protein
MTRFAEAIMRNKRDGSGFVIKRFRFIRERLDGGLR